MFPCQLLFKSHNNMEHCWSHESAAIHPNILNHVPAFPLGFFFSSFLANSMLCFSRYTLSVDQMENAIASKNVVKILDWGERRAASCIVLVSSTRLGLELGLRPV